MTMLAKMVVYIGVNLIGVHQIGVHAGHPRPIPNSGVAFSGVFSSQMVLQRAPAQASVYGWCGDVGRGAQLFSRCNFTSGATVEITMKAAVGSTSVVAFTTQTPIASDGTWKALLPATAAGGTWTILAACSGCGNTSASVLADVTFGDVYFCSGQVSSRFMHINRYGRIVQAE